VDEQWYESAVITSAGNLLVGRLVELSHYTVDVFGRYPGAKSDFYSRVEPSGTMVVSLDLTHNWGEVLQHSLVGDWDASLRVRELVEGASL